MARSFVVLTSLTHPRKILLVVLQIGKAKDLSAPLREITVEMCAVFLRTGHYKLNVDVPLKSPLLCALEVPGSVLG
jgi:hypothetical protein